MGGGRIWKNIFIFSRKPTSVKIQSVGEKKSKTNNERAARWLAYDSGIPRSFHRPCVMVTSAPSVDDAYVSSRVCLLIHASPTPSALMEAQ